jgi:hypothetical protein
MRVGVGFVETKGEVMLYLLKGDKECYSDDEMTGAIIDLDRIQLIKFGKNQRGTHFCIMLDFDDESGWMARFTSEAKARAALADILTHRKQDELMAAEIDCEVMT